MRKSFIITLSIWILSIVVVSGQKIDILDKETINTMSISELKQRTQKLEARYLEIQAMDLYTLSKKELRNIKSEISYIRKESRLVARKGGVYIDPGLAEK